MSEKGGLGIYGINFLLDPLFLENVGLVVIFAHIDPNTIFDTDFSLKNKFVLGLALRWEFYMPNLQARNYGKEQFL